MAGRLRTAGKADLDAAVAANHVPRAGAGGVGLSVAIPGARSRILVNRNGQVTAAGAYYFDRTGQEAPSGFDYNQLPVRSGQRHVIRLLDGTTKAVQIWNAATNEPQRLGRSTMPEQRTDIQYRCLPSSTSLELTGASTSDRTGFRVQLYQAWARLR